MDQERENQKSVEHEIPDEDHPQAGNQQANEFTEPLPEETDASAASEVELDAATPRDDTIESGIDPNSDIREEENSVPNETEKSETDAAANPDADRASLADKPESEPQPAVDQSVQDSKLESGAENLPSETPPENDTAEETISAGGAEAGVDTKEAVDKEGVNEDNGDQVEAEDSKANVTNRRERRSNLSKLAFSTILLFVVIVVLLAYTRPWHHRFGKQPQPHADLPVVQAAEDISAAPVPAIAEPEQNDPYQIYRAKLRDLNRQREALLIKKQEIGELIKHYRAGIKTLENEILQEALRNNIHTFDEALENKRIELKIKAIQRRLVYIDKLDRPLKWLVQGSEELLYLRRKASFDLQVVEIVKGIDMDRHMQQIDFGLQKYRLTADNLAIDPQDAKSLPLETLWKELYTKTKNNPHLLADIENWFIEQEICSGNLKRAGELTIISTEAGRCLAQTEGSDLFLNGIADLSPTIARQLRRWRGKWICLNGIKILSPSAAKHLFQWEGEWISLNGLSAFPPELARYLGQWKGKQLELMGLAFNADGFDKEALEYMAEWEKAGGKLFVPDSIRTMINMVKQI